MVLPRHLLPSDGRFGCGPSKIRAEQMQALDEARMSILGTSHRQQPVMDLVGRIRNGLAELFRLPEGYEVLLGNGGATVLWDAAAFCLIEQRSQHCVFGEFGQKFATAANVPFLDAPDVLSAPAGSLCEAKAVGGIDTYAWTQNETSTGVMAPVARVNGDPGALTVIDATSAAGGIDVDIEQADVYYFSPQKNFGSDGGLWLAIVSPAAIERIERIASTDRYVPTFLNLKAALELSRANQTLNTPALATLVLLENQIQWINENGGLTWACTRTRESSSVLYEWAQSTDYAVPFVANPDHRSQVVVTIDLKDSVSAGSVISTLRENGIVDVDAYRKLGRNQLRVSTFVSIEPDDVRTLTAAIDYIVERSN
jgi:phosphoserine aminotransferase